METKAAAVRIVTEPKSLRWSWKLHLIALAMIGLQDGSEDARAFSDAVLSFERDLETMTADDCGRMASRMRLLIHSADGIAGDDASNFLYGLEEIEAELKSLAAKQGERAA